MVGSFPLRMHGLSGLFSVAVSQPNTIAQRSPHTTESRDRFSALIAEIDPALRRSVACYVVSLGRAC